MCRRLMNFTFICLHCDYNWIRSVVSRGIVIRQPPLPLAAMMLSVHCVITCRLEEVLAITI
jgi:hypothetical protein